MTRGGFFRFITGTASAASISPALNQKPRLITVRTIPSAYYRPEDEIISQSITFEVGDVSGLFHGTHAVALKNGITFCVYSKDWDAVLRAVGERNA